MLKEPLIQPLNTTVATEILFQCQIQVADSGYLLDCVCINVNYDVIDLIAN